MAGTKSSLTLALLAALALALGGCSRRIQTDVPLLETPGWKEIVGQLFVRSEDRGDTRLLIKLISGGDQFDLDGTAEGVAQAPATNGVIYRYDPRKRELDEVRDGLWGEASGEMCCLSTQRMWGDDRVKIVGERLISYQRKRQTTRGNTVTRVEASPSRKWVAVLSADGPVKQSLYSFGKDGTPQGQYYHELFRLPDLAPVGKPIRLPVDRSFHTDHIVWSPDERFLVYADGYRMCIMHIEDQLGSKP